MGGVHLNEADARTQPVQPSMYTPLVLFAVSPCEKRVYPHVTNLGRKQSAALVF